MLAKVFSGATVGLDGVLVEVEVDVSRRGLPSFTIVGLPNKAVEESKERVRTALKNSGCQFPKHRITVNLAPADLPKEGPAYDLPIALGILSASGQLEVPLKKACFLGELSLDGSLRFTKGVLPLAILAKKKGLADFFVPQTNAKEAALVRGLRVFPVASLVALMAFFSGLKKIEPQSYIGLKKLFSLPEPEFDLSEVKGQEQAKRALEIAAAGGHHLLMRGVPGAGKTMLARALPGILPSLTEGEALEVTKIYSITGLLSANQAVVQHRPFRFPHHTTSRVGLIGGGSRPLPGEISLSHRGVLFLDEFPEFPRSVLEALRQPMEDGVVQIARAKGRVTYPASFMLVVAANPCPCGYLGDLKKTCRCSPSQIFRYQKRLSGPILDRIDLHVEVPAVAVEKLTGEGTVGESSRSVQKRVQAARDQQKKRFQNSTKTNAEMKTKQVKKYCFLNKEGLTLLRQAMVNLNLSARAYFKIIKLARTIADLAGEKEIKTNHLAEALQYRPKEPAY